MSNNDSSEQSVGAKIRALRQAMKLTQQQLARPDFSVSYISAIERGQIQPSLRALAILAARLKVSPTELFPGFAPGGGGVGLSMQAQEEAEVELGLIEAQVSIRQGAAPQAIERLQQLATKSLKPQQRIQLQYVLGLAYFQAAQFEESKNALLEAARVLKNADDFYASLRVYNLLGMVQCATHNPKEALAAYQYCIDVLANNSEFHDPVYTAQLYINMSEYYIHLDQFEQAVAMLRQATAVEELATTDQLKASHWRLCQHYIEHEMYQPAALYAYKCLHLYDREARSRVRSELYHQLGHALLQGDQTKALASLDEALRQEQEGAEQDQLSVASIMMHLGAWHFARHDMDKAEQYTREAHQKARLFEDTIIAADASLLLGRIMHARSAPEQGDTYIAAGLEMLERLGKYGQLADELACYSHLLEQHGRHAEALQRLKRAFVLRQNTFVGT